MRSFTYYVCSAIILILYYVVSKHVFDRVYETSQMVIDEQFHLPQGMEYCKGNYSYWDDKITTLPGLYLVSAASLHYFDCNTYNLRLVNLVASCVNLMLFISLLNLVYGKEIKLKVVIQALNLSILPPLFFFSHVYYTDTLSMTFLLAFFRLCLSSSWMVFFGAYSVIMRQTNVVWVAMILGHRILHKLIHSSRVYGNQYLANIKLSIHSYIAYDLNDSKLKRYYNFKDLIAALKFHFETLFRGFFKYTSLQDWLMMLLTASVIAIFCLFVCYNGSIVLGDKQAHTASLHLPQLCYFLLFYLTFGLPHVILKLKTTIEMMLRTKLLALILTVTFLLIVHYNTLVHPYLLADNRHYTFYIWNRYFGKYSFAIYSATPLYTFLIYSLYDNLKNQNCISFFVPYIICLTAAIAFQRLIDVRYFLIPYIVVRLRFAKPTYISLLMEFLWYAALNVLTFKIFLEKEIHWQNFSEPQRMIW